jgi:hypothetical protein
MSKADSIYGVLAKFIEDIALTKKRFDLTELGRMLNAPASDYSGKDLIKAIETFPTECLEQAFCEIIDTLYWKEARSGLGQECIDELVSPIDGDLCFENYFPTEEKRITQQTWIMIDTDRGKRIVLAKRAPNYGVNFRDKVIKTQRVLMNYLKEQVKEMQDFPALFDEKKAKAKEKELTLEYYKWLIISTFEKPPYYVVYNRTRTRKEYLLPHQYDVIDDETLNKYVDLSIGKSKAIKLKPLWTAINKDQIFYLESRGISKDRAIALAMLNQCYIDIDIKMLIDEEREANKHLLTGVA